MLLQALVKVWAKLQAKDPNHLVTGQLAKGWSVHGAVGQTQGACVKFGTLYMVTDPLQNVVCCPALWADLPIPLTCRNRENVNAYNYVFFMIYCFLFLTTLHNLSKLFSVYCDTSSICAFSDTD